MKIVQEVQQNGLTVRTDWARIISTRLIYTPILVDDEMCSTLPGV